MELNKPECGSVSHPSNIGGTPPQHITAKKRASSWLPVLRVLLIAAGLLSVTLFTLLHIQQVSRAQSGPLVLVKKLNNASPVVRVGQVVSFTIALTNNASFTLTNVTLVDDYNQNVLGFAGATPPQDQHDPSTGVLTWNNVANPPIGVGQTLSFTVFFTAEHPQTTVVNFARAQDITGTASAISDTQATDQIDEAVGGAAPLFKSLSPPGSTPQVGEPVTFTQIITNDGAALITFLPLTDTYNAAYLEFHYAIPTPTITGPPGTLAWADLTTFFGNLAPFDTVVVTTVFTASAQVVNTVNRASIEGARDQYNNDLTVGEALVPITIIGDTPTPTPGRSQDDDEDDDVATPTPATITLVTPTPITQQEVFSGSNAPRYLPETGRRDSGQGLAPFFCLALLAVVGFILVTRRR